MGVGPLAGVGRDPVDPARLLRSGFESCKFTEIADAVEFAINPLKSVAKYAANSVIVTWQQPKRAYSYMFGQRPNGLLFLTFLEGDLLTTVNAFLDWGGDRRPELIVEHAADWRDIAVSYSEFSLDLFIQVLPGWTVHSSNDLKGGRWNENYYLSRQLRTRAVTFSTQVPVDEPYPSPSFTMTYTDACDPARIIERSVGVYCDYDKSEFTARGEPLPFETPSVYKAKRPRDRINHSLLVAYARSLGLELEIQDGCGPAVKIQRKQYGGGPKQNADRAYVVRDVIRKFLPEETEGTFEISEDRGIFRVFRSWLKRPKS